MDRGMAMLVGRVSRMRGQCVWWRGYNDDFLLRRRLTAVMPKVRIGRGR